MLVLRCLGILREFGFDFFAIVDHQCISALNLALQHSDAEAVREMVDSLGAGKLKRLTSCALSALILAATTI